MAVVTVDSGNLEQVLANAAGEEVESSQPSPPTKEEKATAKAKPADKPASEVAPTDPPTEVKDDADDADDEEGDDGLTARQKRELSEKMLKAIGKKHRQVKEAEEFAADQIRLAREAERRAERAETELSKARAVAKPEPEKEAIEPTRENFATETEFIDARIQWGVDQGIARREAERAETARQNRVAAQLAKAAELVPDFQKVTDANLNWPGPVAQYMRDSEMFAELGYFFSKNPQELERIAALPPIKQLVDIGKIESRLTPFGSRSTASDTPKDEPDGKADKAAPSTDTGFSPSKARSDAPVIKPLSDGGQALEPNLGTMSTREAIQAYQKSKGVSLTVRRRH